MRTSLCPTPENQERLCHAPFHFLRIWEEPIAHIHVLQAPVVEVLWVSGDIYIYIFLFVCLFSIYRHSEPPSCINIPLNSCPEHQCGNEQGTNNRADQPSHEDSLWTGQPIPVPCHSRQPRVPTLDHGWTSWVFQIQWCESNLVEEDTFASCCCCDKSTQA